MNFYIIRKRKKDWTTCDRASYKFILQSVRTNSFNLPSSFDYQYYLGLHLFIVCR